MEDFVEVRKYIAALFRWWWLIVLLSLISGIVGYEASKRQTPVYVATTTLMVGQSIQSTDLTKTDIQTSELLALTYADIARRQPLLQGVIKALNLSDSERALRKRVKIELVSGTQLLELQVEAGSLQEAQNIADELARQLILQSPAGLQAQEATEKQQFINQRLENLQTKIENGQQRLATLEQRMRTSLPTDQLQELQSEINKLETLTFDWEESYTQLLIFAESRQSPNHLTVIEPAQGSANPVRPEPKLHALLAGAVGLLLALGFIFLREYLDDTLKSAGDLSQSLGLTPLGAIGRMQGKQYQEKLITTQDPFSPISETYRMIRSNIQFMSVDRPAKSIMVTSSTPHEGKSTTVANLGVVIAQAGLKTVIVDTDLRRPVQHQIFQAPNLGGVTDLLRVSEPDLNRHLRKTGIENLYLITAGVSPPNPSELLSSHRMERMIGNLTELADVVIFDSPPTLVVADAAVLSNRVDGVVLVVHAGQTRRNAVRQTIFNLQQAGANLLGGVLNQAPEKGTNNAYYYSYTALDKREPARQLPNLGQWRRWGWLPFLK